MDDLAPPPGAQVRCKADIDGSGFTPGRTYEVLPGFRLTNDIGAVVIPSARFEETAPVQALTLETLRAAMRQLEDFPPILETVRCGSLDRFKAKMKQRFGPLVVDVGTLSLWAGVPVVEVRALHEARAVLHFNDGSVKIIDLDQEERT
ncbi:hypothetical protein ACM25O_13290 [Sulfitobacter pontiacus]